MATFSYTCGLEDLPCGAAAFVVPADFSEKVLVEAERLTATEITIRAELDAGATLEQVLAKYGHV